MKKLITLSILLIVAVSGCTKSTEKKPNTVKYVFYCDSCSATMQTANDSAKTVQVKKFFIRAEINELHKIKISTTGAGKIQSKIIVNDKTVHDETSEQKGDTVSYTVDVD